MARSLPVANGELLVAVNHNQQWTMTSVTVGPIDWSHSPPSWAVLPELHVFHGVNAGYKSQDMLHQPGLEHAPFGTPCQRTACAGTHGGNILKIIHCDGKVNMIRIVLFFVKICLSCCSRHFRKTLFKFMPIPVHFLLVWESRARVRLCVRGGGCMRVCGTCADTSISVSVPAVLRSRYCTPVLQQGHQCLCTCRAVE